MNDNIFSDSDQMSSFKFRIGYITHTGEYHWHLLMGKYFKHNIIYNT